MTDNNKCTVKLRATKKILLMTGNESTLCDERELIERYEPKVVQLPIGAIVVINITGLIGDENSDYKIVDQR